MNLKLVEVQTFVSDKKKALQFYQELLGFKLKQQGDDWLIFDLQGMEFVVMSGAVPAPKQVGCSLQR